MPRLKPGDKPLTPEEDAAVEAAILDDPDTIALDAEWFAGAQPAAIALPHIVEEYIRERDGLAPRTESKGTHVAGLSARTLPARVAPTVI